MYELPRTFFHSVSFYAIQTLFRRAVIERVGRTRYFRAAINAHGVSVVNPDFLAVGTKRIPLFSSSATISLSSSIDMCLPDAFIPSSNSFTPTHHHLSSSIPTSGGLCLNMYVIYLLISVIKYKIPFCNIFSNCSSLTSTLRGFSNCDDEMNSFFMFFHNISPNHDTIILTCSASRKTYLLFVILNDIMEV